MAGDRGWWPIAGIVLGLVGLNVVQNRVVSPGFYVPVAVAAAVALLAFARIVDGRSWDQLGLARRHVGRGLVWGAVLAGVVVAVYLVGLTLPSTRDLFRDDRVRDWTIAQSLVAALVRVPLGTVLVEEVAFRGVLPAVLGVRTRRWVAVGASAGLFGLWHLLPALGIGRVNPVAQDSVASHGMWVAVLAAVVSTAAVGVWFWWLRHRARSLLAPMALHWATNGLGYLFAAYAWRH
ncbi:MAG: CPBP family intramembrane glutamic endopeptidase [Acidimicrobiales bacterium]